MSGTDRPVRSYGDLPMGEESCQPCDCETCSNVRLEHTPKGRMPLLLWRVRGPDTHRHRPMYFWEMLVAARTRQEALFVHPLSTEKWWRDEYGADWISCGRQSAYESWHLPHDLTCEVVGVARESIEPKEVIIRW